MRRFPYSPFPMYAEGNVPVSAWVHQALEADAVRRGIVLDVTLVPWGEWDVLDGMRLWCVTNDYFR